MPLYATDCVPCVSQDQLDAARAIELPSDCMTNLTDHELDAMEARASAATPGPWWSWVEGRDGLSGDTFIGRGLGESRGSDLYLFDEHGRRVSDEDHDFIAAARQDLPRLLTEVRRLRALVK